MRWPAPHDLRLQRAPQLHRPPPLATARRRRGHHAVRVVQHRLAAVVGPMGAIVRALERADHCERAIDQPPALRAKGEEARSTNPGTPNRKRPGISINDSENLRSQHFANVQHLALRLRQRGCSVRIRNEGLVARRIENPDSRPHDNVVAGKAGDFSGSGR